jgi:hypothetical protein
MSNPYSDEPYLTAWQYGSDYGSQNPGDTDPQSPDFSSWGYDDDITGYVVQVWREGALAGRDGSSGGASTGDGGSGADSADASGSDLIQLPSDLADELVRFREYYPETTALCDAGDVDTWLQYVVGVEYIPTDDDDDLPVA